MISPKRLAYCSYNAVQRAWWSLLGRREIHAFGQHMRFTASTEFPSLRGLRHPPGRSRSRIVGFADYVQMHACCRLLEDCRDRPVVVDVGAHHGVYAILAGSFAKGLGGCVIAVEPVNENASVLRRNIELNGLSDTVFVEECAIVERASRVNVTVAGSESAVRSDGVGDCEVDGVPLSDVLRKYDVDHVDLLIVDCEGAELPVLRSIDWERYSVGTVFCELHPYNWPMFGYDGHALSAFLRAHGLRCLDMYFHEWTEFTAKDYIGPCLLLPRDPAMATRC